MSDTCWRCGGDDLRFDRTLLPPCDSMHYVCRKCGATQPCGDFYCFYEGVDKEAEDE